MKKRWCYLDVIANHQHDKSNDDNVALLVVRQGTFYISVGIRKFFKILLKQAEKYRSLPDEHPKHSESRKLHQQQLHLLQVTLQASAET